MNESKTEVLIGALVLVVAAVFLIYAGKTTGYSTATTNEYSLHASFRAADGISIGTDVRMAGVKVGRVTDLRLDPKTFRADAEFTVTDGIELPDDSAVEIASEGLLGGNYVQLIPGGSPITLEPGAEIEFTQGSVSLISLLMKFVSGSGSSSNSSGTSSQ